MPGKYIYFLILVVVLVSCKTGKPKLEKIIFHSSMCFGTCSVYHLEVKNNQDVRLFAETVYKDPKKLLYEEDFEKEGCFVGKANATDYKRLDSILQNIGLDTLTFKDITCCDGVVYTIIVYYDGEKKIFKSMLPPESANELISTLYDICTNSALKPASKDFVLETMIR